MRDVLRDKLLIVGKLHLKSTFALGFLIDESHPMKWDNSGKGDVMDAAEEPAVKGKGSMGSLVPTTVPWGC